MNIFGFYVSIQIPTIEYFAVYGGLWTPGGISSFFSLNFLSNGVRIMSGDQFLTSVMSIFINVTILDKRTVGRADGRAEGRSGGRTVGRADGRAGHNESKPSIIESLNV